MAISVTKIYTYAEMEAASLCQAAGILPMATDESGDPRRAIRYILGLAERIKNERMESIMHSVANR